MAYNCDDMSKPNTLLASITVIRRTKMSANKRGRPEVSTVFFIKVSPLRYCERNRLWCRLYFLLPTSAETVIVFMKSSVTSQSSIHFQSCRCTSHVLVQSAHQSTSHFERIRMKRIWQRIVKPAGRRIAVVHICYACICLFLHSCLWFP
jgi:hypothetical protein